jgi:hypothetical protein
MHAGFLCLPLQRCCCICAGPDSSQVGGQPCGLLLPLSHPLLQLKALQVLLLQQLLLLLKLCSPLGSRSNGSLQTCSLCLRCCDGLCCVTAAAAAVGV